MEHGSHNIGNSKKSARFENLDNVLSITRLGGLTNLVHR